jgi:KDO2-lipid IV(A) lauroyltransferase
MPKKTATDYVPLYRFWKPRYWLLWTGLGILRLLVMLPFRIQWQIGRLFGRLMMVAVPKRRRIAEINLQLCFPKLEAAELRRLLRAHSESIGFSVFEVGLALWAGQGRIERLFNLEGLENLTTPLEQGQGVIVLSGHFPAIELVSRVAGKILPQSAAMYRPLKNPLIDQLLRRARSKSGSILIPKEGARQMIRLLRKGTPVWYAADQSYDRVNAELVPFFGEPAMTNASLTNIARISKVCVVPFYPRRHADSSGYTGEFLPALENFPTDDPAADAERVNRLLEEWIRKAPEQYYWVHRRFKNRPDPYPDPYQDI